MGSGDHDVYDPEKGLALNNSIDNSPREEVETWLSVSEYAKRWGFSENRVRNMCKNGIIPNAEKVGGKWRILVIEYA